MTKEQRRKKRAFRDAMKDINKEYPRIAPDDLTTKRKYKGQRVEWYVARAMKEIDRIDSQMQEAATTECEPPMIDRLDPLFEQLEFIRDEDDNLLETIRMDQLIAMLPDDQMICVGSYSGYFFMGVVSEYKKTIRSIETYFELRNIYRYSRDYAYDDSIIPLTSAYDSTIPFRRRTVEAVFTRDFPGEPVMLAISLSGEEISPFMLYSEYRRAVARNYPYECPKGGW